ncbi:alpha-amylase family glycosyl hydrolase [Microtetraspora niveoalba]|uniref:alpha-amylase family glycosyl hydrolase n=1 Tax=Microtetraspora niveoalba TaxID=46175 RepID=UPI000A9AF6B5|nr:alpha-amylase family glycosyl hydrolase [Microtetraspora niveoalba]
MPLHPPQRRRRPGAFRLLGPVLAATLAALPLLPVPPASAYGLRHGEPAHPVRSGPSRAGEPGDRQLARSGERPALSRERFYFLMTDRFANGSTANDRGGLTGDRLTTGFDPTDSGFYQGGDLAGILRRLDYIKGLGTTAIWLTPAFRNRPVQGTGANASAGYHGYWITDFTRVDPHLGNNADMKKLVQEAHRRGMKVFFDIITNHTADGIDYAEKQYGYRGKNAYPYLDADGRPFDDRDHADGTKPFPKVGSASFPYTPVPVPGVTKSPAWLNDPTMYHNRGDSTFAGESSQYGDFVGLDDLWTERPEVVRGMTDIYTTWVRETGIDGFRIDTAKHVNMEFWRRFAPDVKGYARRLGNKDFFMFGEVFTDDPTTTSLYSTTGGMSATLDFPFQAAARAYASQGAGAAVLSALYRADDYYTDADSNAYSLPTFLGNHDMGRFGYFLKRDNPRAGDAELLRRDLLAHELMYLTRGQPVVYYGDEQGFTGQGGDKAARAPMFASRTAAYLSDDLIGTTATHAQDNFVARHPLYRGISALATLTDRHPALRDGAQIERLSDGGVYAFSRIDADRRIEYVVALNNGSAARRVKIPTYSERAAFTPIYPNAGAPVTTGADRTLDVTVPALSAVVYQAGKPISRPAAAPEITVTLPDDGLTGRAEITADVPGGGFDQVTFAAKAGAGPWTVLGTDDARPFRVFHDVGGLAAGTSVTYKAVVRDSAGRIASAGASATVAARPPAEEPGEQRRDWLVVHYQRPGGDYDGWGLQADGDVARPSTSDAPVPFSGEDAYGRFAWIRLKPGAGAVTLSVRNGDQRDGAARTVDPARSAEIWLTQGEEDAATSLAEARGYATVHYRRPDKTYDGWGLHLWGGGLADGTATEWNAPRPADGRDEYGVYWKVPVRDVDAPVGFIVHKGDQKDPGGDQSLLPSAQPDGWVDSGVAAVHPTRAAADNVAILHYNRPDGDYEGWGAHVFGSGAARPTEWDAPLAPAGRDGFGVYFTVPLTAGASSVSYILHKGGEKDLPDDQVLEFPAYGNEVWIQAATPGYVLPQTGGRGLDADLSVSKAHWIDGTTLAWDVKPLGTGGYAMVYSPKRDLAIKDGELAGDVHVLRLVPVAGGLAAEQRERHPDLASYAAFTVDPRDTGRVAAAVAGQLAATERSGDGRLLTVTGVRIVTGG